MDSETEKAGWKLVLRILALTLVLINLAFCFMYFNPLSLLVVFSNWTLELSIALSIIVLWSSFDSNISEKKERLGAIHLIGELAFVTNLITVFVYWSILHPGALDRLEGHKMKILHYYLVHTFPAISVFLIFLTTDI